MTATKKTIILVGGGTGGHAVPIFEIYKELKAQKKEIEIIVVGSGTETEKKIFSDTKIDNYEVLKTGKLHRRFTLKNLHEFFLILLGLAKSYILLRKYKPDLIFSKGGYVGVPLLFWAKRLNIPYFIHESDVDFGFANKWSADKAKKVFVGLPLEYYKEKNIEYAGQFISKDYYKYDKIIPLFNEARPTVLFTGGSQGAVAINKVVVEALPLLLKKYNIIHQTGSLDYERAKKAKEGLGQELSGRYIIQDFFEQGTGRLSMENVFLNSDIFLGRASATTPAEATAFKKPLILIPYPHSSGGHQNKNAKILAEAGACEVINQSDLSPEILFSKIEELFASKDKQKSLVAGATKIFSKNAIDTVVLAINQELKL